MLTPATRATVSVLAVFAATLTLGGCASRAARTSLDDAFVTPERRLIIRFDNEAQTYVDVYLVGERRQWHLGRVAAGSKTTLRIPVAAVEESTEFVRLAVLSEAPPSMQVLRDPHATLTIAQPAFRLTEQSWTYWPKLSSPELFGAPIRGGRP
jgi:hypothetical protein